MKSATITVLLMLLMFSQTGCQLINAGNEIIGYTWSAYKPRPSDRKNPTNDDQAEWDFVGRDARGHQTKEKEVDRFWWNHVMSAKARSIEGNMGIE